MERVGVSDFEVQQAFNSCLDRVLVCQSGLLGTEGEADSGARQRSRQVDQSAAVATAHVEHMRAPERKTEQVDAVIEHPDLRVLGRFIAFEKQSMMNVVAPEGAIDEGERVVVLSDFDRP